MEVHVQLKNAFLDGIGNRRITFGYNHWFASHPSTHTVSEKQLPRRLSCPKCARTWVSQRKWRSTDSPPHMESLNPHFVNLKLNWAPPCVNVIKTETRSLRSVVRAVSKRRTEITLSHLCAENVPYFLPGSYLSIFCPLFLNKPHAWRVVSDSVVLRFTSSSTSQLDVAHFNGLRKDTSPPICKCKNCFNGLF